MTTSTHNITPIIQPQKLPVSRYISINATPFLLLTGKTPFDLLMVSYATPHWSVCINQLYRWKYNYTRVQNLLKIKTPQNVRPFLVYFQYRFSISVYISYLISVLKYLATLFLLVIKFNVSQKC